MSLKKIGASIVLEGEKEYRSALKNINSEQKELKSEMQLCSAEFKNSQNTSEALAEKYGILSRQLEAQKEKVSVYAKAVEEAQKAQTDAGDSVEKYSKELEDAQTELEKMKNSSDASAESIEEQEKKVAELQTQLDNSNASYDKATQNLNNWQTGLNIAQAQLVNLDSALQETGGYLEEANKSVDGCAKSIDQFGKKLEEDGDSAINFGDIMKANLASDIVMSGLETMIGLISTAGDKLFELATSAAYYADNVNTMSTKTGVATDTIQALMYSEELLDVSLDTVTGSMAKNIKSMDNAAQGSEKYAEAYDKLNVSVTDGNGKLRNSEDVFWDVIDALGKMTSTTEKDAIAMQIFGKSAQNLNPLIKAGSSGFKEMKKEAEDLGYVLDQDTLNSLNGTSDSLERLSKYVDAIKNEIGADLTDSLAEGANKVYEAIEANKDSIEGVIETIIPKLVDGFVVLVDNIDKIIPLVNGLVTGFITFKTTSIALEVGAGAMELYRLATSGAATAQTLLNAAMESNPIGLIAGLCAGATVALIELAKNIKNTETALDQLENKYAEQVQANKDAIDKRTEANKAVDNEIVTIKNLGDELKKLNEKENLSNEEKAKMKMLVDELNTAMPELNLQLNEETGHLSMTNEELEKQLENKESLLKLNAAEADLADIASQKYEAEKQLASIESERAQHLEDMRILQDALNEAVEQGITSSGELIDVYGDGSLVGDVNYLSACYDSFNETLDVYNKAVEDQNGVISELDVEYQNVTGIINGYSDAVDKNNQLLDQGKEYSVLYKDSLVTATGESATALMELETAYNEAKTAAEESIQKQVGLFDELSNESELSVKQMAENLNQQTDVMNTYADDMIKAKDLVEQGLMEEGLLGAIQEMGLSGAGYLHELVTSAETDQQAFNDVMLAWADQQEAVDNISSTIADIQTSYSDGMEEIITSIEGANEEQAVLQENSIGQWGVYCTELEKALGEGATKSKTEGTLIGTNAVKGAKDALGIDEQGNSSEGYSIGESYTSAISQAILAGSDSILSAVDSVCNAANERAKERVKDINRSLGGDM